MLLLSSFTAQEILGLVYILGLGYTVVLGFLSINLVSEIKTETNDTNVEIHGKIIWWEMFEFKYLKI